MNAHTFDRLKHFGVGIPEEPDEVNIQPVLASLEWGAKVRWDTANKAEIERLRGTPGEPVPIKTSTFVEILRWLDGYKPKIRFLKPYDPNYLIPNRNDQRMD